MGPAIPNLSSPIRRSRPFPFAYLAAAYSGRLPLPGVSPSWSLPGVTWREFPFDTQVIFKTLSIYSVACRSVAQRYCPSLCFSRENVFGFPLLETFFYLFFLYLSNRIMNLGWVVESFTVACLKDKMSQGTLVDWLRWLNALKSLQSRNEERCVKQI